MDCNVGYPEGMATYRNRPAYAGGGIGTRVAVARVITAAASVVAAIIVAAIVLHLLNANPSNGIVDAIHQAGSWLTTPFHNLFSPSNGDVKMALNWGLAAVVYLIIARVIARLVVR
jgi:hypothetical protein